jgi:hypothetical protein
VRLVGDHQLRRGRAGGAVPHNGEQVVLGEPPGRGGDPQDGVDLRASGECGELDPYGAEGNTCSRPGAPVASAVIAAAAAGASPRT